MKTLNNFLTSGHLFSGDDNLQKFRFSFLNSVLIIASLFSFINYFASLYGFIELTPVYEKAVLAFAFVCLILVYFLRKRKSYYPLSVAIILFSALSLFYFALITAIQDEFRLIWFFLTLFIGFILMGKKYGIMLMIFILIGVYSVEETIGLGLSKLAFFTFFNSFLIFSAFSYFFLMKIERDSLEFEILNNKLKQNVIQERRQREEQEQMLLRQCRMANMGEMLDSIAHQWRQPLMHINSVLMNMDSTLDTKDPRKKGKDYLTNKIDEVASLTAHMSQTIEDFRGLFKTEQEQTHFTIEQAINDVLTLMKNIFNNVEINNNTTGDTSIHSHRSELIQVIIILLSNAVDVLNKRKIVSKKIIIDTNTTKKEVVISIEDNAGGIIPINLETIFDPYFTTKEQSGGTGLGLYIAKIIVEHKMQGNISASNTPNGAKFTITLSKQKTRKEDALHT